MVQTSYQIQAAQSKAALSTGDLLWDSGAVASNTSLLVPYGGPALQSGQRVAWRVRVETTIGGTPPNQRLERPGLVGDGLAASRRLARPVDFAHL